MGASFLSTKVKGFDFPFESFEALKVFELPPFRGHLFEVTSGIKLS